LRELETSLLVSQRALLCCDVAAVESGTEEQRHLIAAMSTAMPAAGTDTRALVERVRHLARVQALLLLRAAQRLRMIAHVLAGTTSCYGPLAVPDFTPGEEQRPCRV